jgi:hypothetical protein
MPYRGGKATVEIILPRMLIFRIIYNDLLGIGIPAGRERHGAGCKPAPAEKNKPCLIYPFWF